MNKPQAMPGVQCAVNNRMGVAALAGTVLLIGMPDGAWGAQPDITQLSWLSGCWKAENAEPGSGEQWTRPAGGAMIGTSRTIRQGKMVEFEFMQFRTQNDGSLVFIAQPSGSPPTTFRLKALDKTGVTFENIQHDFPQRVIYSMGENGNISARIEGVVNGALRAIHYPMMRVDCKESFGAPK
jgi:hypothetical protein